MTSRLLEWLRRRDPGLIALRRASRAALVMPLLFAFGVKVVENVSVATFAAFGSFAMLLFVDFGGPMRQRLEAEALLALSGAVLVVLGTAVSNNAWVAAAAMALVAFAVLFAGVVSSTLASAAPALLLAFILSVTLPAPLSDLPDRLGGWALASVSAWLAVALLWPAPARDPLRGVTVASCRALARRVRIDSAYQRGGVEAPSAEERDRAGAEASEAVAQLRARFVATPYRPTALGTESRTLVRLVDELTWLDAILRHSRPSPSAGVDLAVCAVKASAAEVLDECADVLERKAADASALEGVVASLRRAQADSEAGAMLPSHLSHDGSLVSALDPSFRAQEIAFAVSQIASNVQLAAAAESRSWGQRLLGRQPEGVDRRISAAQERAAAHVERHSVWLHNSVRGALGLGIAVLIADLSGVQHSFWVVLGTLSVLRSNALSTGQNVVRGLLGTLVGFAVGAALLAVVGTSTAVLWALLPVAVLVAGFVPATVSFAAGQAAFTLAIVILYNILQPAGWRVGLLRIEDVAIGCAVSLGVGLLFWPRGAAAALGRALAEAYEESARYLAGAVGYGLARCDPTAVHSWDSPGCADPGGRCVASFGRRLSPVSGGARSQAPGAR